MCLIRIVNYANIQLSHDKKTVIDKIINNIMREINWDGSNDIEKIKIFNINFIIVNIKK